MPDPILNSRTLDVLQVAMRGLSLRQQVIGQNMANVDTPGYKAATVSFEDELKRVADPSSAELRLVSTHDAHLGLAALDDPQVAQRPNLTLRNDGNSVDVDKEMVELAETSLRFQSLAQLASKQLATLRAAIAER
ncbi:MAG: flagellar basal body rod protein FlgB [Chloroflexi bacterium]|nr:flagellar basal body rod protein FlgB [Chloroflexota bacterium]